MRGAFHPASRRPCGPLGRAPARTRDLTRSRSYKGVHHVAVFSRRRPHRKPAFSSGSPRRRSNSTVHRGGSSGSCRVAENERHGAFTVVRIALLQRCQLVINVVSFVFVFVFVVLVLVLVIMISVWAWFVYILIMVVVVIVAVFVFVFFDGYMGARVRVVGPRSRRREAKGS